MANGCVMLPTAHIMVVAAQMSFLSKVNGACLNLGQQTCKFMQYTTCTADILCCVNVAFSCVL